MQKKIPQRQCMGCRERMAKKELIRVVRGTDGTVNLDFSGKQNGRGAYICKNEDCFNKAIKKKSFFRAFGVDIPEETRQGIEGELKGE